MTAKLVFAEGKYSIYKKPNGVVVSERYDQPWREFLGDHLITAMFDRLVEQEQTIEAAKRGESKACDVLREQLAAAQAASDQHFNQAMSNGASANALRALVQKGKDNTEALLAIFKEDGSQPLLETIYALEIQEMDAALKEMK